MPVEDPTHPGAHARPLPIPRPIPRLLPETRRAALPCAITAALCAFAGAAHAQSTAPAPRRIPPITVEGRTPGDYDVGRSASPKFTAPLLDTPKSVTIIPQQVINERNATSLDEVLRTVPGITLGAGEGGVPNADLPNIRGFGAEANIYVDGVRDPGSQTRSVFNLEQVEVIKGPGSAYGGRGTTGGSLNLVTKKAKAGNVVSGTGSLGLPLRGRATLDGNYQVSDGAAVRLNLMVDDGEVAGRDEVTTSSLGIAPSLTLGLGGPTRATLSFQHLQTDDIPDYSHPYDTVTGMPVNVDRDNFYGLTNRDFQQTKSDIGTLELTHDFSDRLTLRNLTRYGWSENDFIVTNPDDSAGNVINGAVWRAVKSRNADTTVFVNQTDLSGDLDTGSFAHSYNVGVEVSREETGNRGYSVDTGNRNCAVTGIGAASGFNCTSLAAPNPDDPWSGAIAPSGGSSQTRVHSLGVYAFDTVQLTQRWLVNLGVRFDRYSTEASSSGGRGGPFNGSNDSNFVNYQAGVVYKPRPQGSVYASFGTSSDPSGTTAGEGRDNLGSANVALDPEESRSFEIGTKWEVFNGRLSLTGALFRTEKTNARVDDPLGGPSDVLQGEQRVDGVELGVAGNVTERWAVFGGYTYMRSEIVDDGPGTDDGNEMPNVPRHSLGLWSTFDVAPRWTLGGGLNYVSRRFGNTANTRSVPSYWLLDGMLEFRPTKHIELRLNAKNLLDETYYLKPYTTHYATVGPGRAFILTAGFSY